MDVDSNTKITFDELGAYLGPFMPVYVVDLVQSDELMPREIRARIVQQEESAISREELQVVFGDRIPISVSLFLVRDHEEPEAARRELRKRLRQFSHTGNMDDLPVPPSPDRIARALAVLEAVEDFRDEHEISCAETFYQSDRVQMASAELAEKVVSLAGYGKFSATGLNYLAPDRR